MIRRSATRWRAGTLATLFAPAVVAAQEPAAAAKATQICLAPVTVEAAPTGMDPVTAVRDAFTSFAGCRFLLLPSIKHERKTGGGLLGKVAGGAVQQGAWAVTGSAGSTVGRVVAGAAAGAASSAVSDYAYGSRSKDELTLQYRLESGSGAVLAEKTEKRKAKSDGEDLLTPVVQRAAEAIVAAAGKGSS
jgi:hypothetical protein